MRKDRPPKITPPEPTWRLLELFNDDNSALSKADIIEEIGIHLDPLGQEISPEDVQISALPMNLRQVLYHGQPTPFFVCAD